MNVEEPPSGDPDPLEEELLPFVNQGAADGRIVTGSTDVLVGCYLPGSGGQSPPRVSIAIPISASGL